MGTNCAPLLADLFLCSYENEFLDSIVRSGHRRLAKSFNLCYRYIDDLIVFKVTGSSLLIHASVYSLFVVIYSVISNMTGYSHSCHSIKLIHWGAPERDVLSDKMVL